MPPKEWLFSYFQSFSFVGLVVAMLFFAASLTPSLLPRNLIFQGLLSGFALATGYGLGVGFQALYQFLEIPVPPYRYQRAFRLITLAIVALIVIFFLWQMTYWQNSVRSLMKMDALQSNYPIRTALTALAVGAGLIAVARILELLRSMVSKKLNHYLPRRIAFFLSVTIVVLGTIFVANGVVARGLLNAADAFFLNTDGLVDDDVAQPRDAMACGSSQSLVEWDSIGRRGKTFIVSGPSRTDLDQFWNSETMQPVRVYVGMRSAATKRDQAILALKELKRVGGFERSVLVVATPTGTGWLDPGAVDTLEYLHGGDTAIVSMQYSYLPSWITILVDPERSIESARYLFDEIYGYWKTLPQDRRPKLYLHGLSLGSLGSELSAAWYTVLEDPPHGAVWSGPPFPSRQWASITQTRNSNSPAWLPKFRDGALVRFTAQKNALETGERWGAIRNVYIQYASDPMVFFSPDLLFKSPEWLQDSLGPDVSPYLKWIPVVTFLQIAFDLPMSMSVPIGFGHNYSAASYIDAWIAVTQPKHWQAAYTQRLKKMITQSSL